MKLVTNLDLVAPADENQEIKLPADYKDIKNLLYTSLVLTMNPN